MPRLTRNGAHVPRKPLARTLGDILPTHAVLKGSRDIRKRMNKIYRQRGGRPIPRRWG